MTVVKQCKCQHEFQDKTYGKQNRVHNFSEKGNNGNPGWRCTVCSNVKSAGINKETV